MSKQEKLKTHKLMRTQKPKGTHFYPHTLNLNEMIPDLNQQPQTIIVPRSMLIQERNRNQLNKIISKLLNTEQLSKRKISRQQLRSDHYISKQRVLLLSKDASLEHYVDTQCGIDQEKDEKQMINEFENEDNQTISHRSNSLEQKNFTKHKIKSQEKTNSTPFNMISLKEFNFSKFRKNDRNQNIFMPFQNKKLLTNLLSVTQASPNNKISNISIQQNEDYQENGYQQREYFNGKRQSSYRPEILYKRKYAKRQQHSKLQKPCFSSEFKENLFESTHKFNIPQITLEDQDLSLDAPQCVLPSCKTRAETTQRKKNLLQIAMTLKNKEYTFNCSQNESNQQTQDNQVVKHKQFVPMNVRHVLKDQNSFRTMNINESLSSTTYREMFIKNEKVNWKNQKQMISGSFNSTKRLRKLPQSQIGMMIESHKTLDYNNRYDTLLNAPSGCNSKLEFPKINL